MSNHVIHSFKGIFYNIFNILKKKVYKPKNILDFSVFFGLYIFLIS
jgi:hypothetical protein